MIESDKKPLIGVFPCFEGMGENYPYLKIAKRYEEIGGKVVIFSHGGEYEYMAKEYGFDVVRIKPIGNGGFLTNFLMQRNERDVIKLIEDEAMVYKNAGIEALLQSNVFFDCLLAPKVAEIPIISLVAGSSIPSFLRTHATYPDSSENFFTILLPQFFKNYLARWYLQNYSGPIIKKMNRIANNLGIDHRFRCMRDLVVGDLTLISDDINFLDLKPTREFPAKNFVGPILPNIGYIRESQRLDSDIKKHLKRPGKHILITMGSSFTWKEIFLRILDFLNDTEYNVIATNVAILKEDEIPDFSDNILIKKFITEVNILHSKVDLSIIHGGRGTVYSSVYAGKPVIGFPLHYEQQYNLDNLVRHGIAIRLSKTFFSEKKLSEAIKEILNNYDKYLKNAQALSKKITEPKGAINAANRIAEFLERS